MAQLQVTFQDLASGSSALKSGSSNIESQLQAMRSQVEGFHATWQGSAKNQFDNLLQQWESSGRQLLEALRGISDILGQASQAYEQAEVSIQGSFNQG